MLERPDAREPRAAAEPRASHGLAGRRWDSRVLGGLLILVGAVLLLGRVTSIDLGRYGWPLFVILPGVLILMLASSNRGAISEGLAIMGSLLTVTGLILLYQNSTGRFESWAYAWPLLMPGAVGAGMVLYGWRVGRRGNIRIGVRMIAVAVALVVVGAIFFELVLGIGGFTLGPWSGVLLSVLVMAAGVAVLLRNLRAAARRDSG
ncbi:MAG: hypothetical protein M3Z11_01700 [Candidatus Dormibacteraeota bacterium]|nr:hypothetical protein [Candidatus Dormibacteraeota bacterium]